MSDLRLQLARRFVEIFIVSVESRPTTPDGFPGSDEISLLPLADECIRQMEWARHTLPVDRSFELPWNPETPLTAAPDGWSPK